MMIRLAKGARDHLVAFVCAGRTCDNAYLLASENHRVNRTCILTAIPLGADDLPLQLPLDVQIQAV